MVFYTPRSYLLTERKDLGLSDRDLADVFLSALMSMLKSLSAVRLECMGVMYRFMWHGGSWLDSAVEYPSFFHRLLETKRVLRTRTNLFKPTRQRHPSHHFR